MKNYTITIDTGTTNTRVYLFNEKYEAVASALRCGRRDPGVLGGEIQPDQQPWLLRRLQLLCTYFPSGKDHAGEKPRVAVR